MEHKWLPIYHKEVPDIYIWLAKYKKGGAMASQRHHYFLQKAAVDKYVDHYFSNSSFFAVIPNFL